MSTGLACLRSLLSTEIHELFPGWYIRLYVRRHCALFLFALYAGNPCRAPIGHGTVERRQSEARSASDSGWCYVSTSYVRSCGFIFGGDCAMDQPARLRER